MLALLGGSLYIHFESHFPRMKIFVGYGYNPRDEWVWNLVFPLIKAFGAEPVSGKEIAGQPLGDAIKELIKHSDAVIGFTTKRDATVAEGGIWGTHRWVTDELSTANALDVPFAEVREKGITPQDGILNGRGYIEYEEGKRDECLVAIAQRVGSWIAEGGRFEWHLLPQEFAMEVSPLLNDGNLKCKYQILGPDDVEPSEPRTGRVIPVQQGLAVRVRNVPKNAMIRLWIECGNKLYWESAYQPIESRMIHLKKGNRP